MKLSKLNLLNFKNYQEVSIEFPERINVLVGKNGSGKTNLLDAIHYLSMTKSAFSSADNHCIKHGEGAFMVKGCFKRDDRESELLTAVQSGSKKVFRENQLDYSRLSDHIGKYPVVLIAPDDVDLVKDGSEARRKFFDSILSQLDQQYLQFLIQYNHILKQRNGLLRMFYETNSFDAVALETYDNLLSDLGEKIFKKRMAFVEEYLPVFAKYYRFIVNEAESTNMVYISDLKETDFVTGLKSVRQKDLFLQRTNFGIHRDEYQFTLQDGDLKRLGSQGQQKSFIIALKLAQFEILEKAKSFKPILLLDDIFDKLDDIRIGKLLELIKQDLGQLFITDARPERTIDLLRSISVPAAIFKVEEGMVTSLPYY
jgi:DNA replication and repair protein RecF